MKLKRIEVVAAIIKHKDRFLCVQRAESKLPYISKKFEFPGGKIEIGETKLKAPKFIKFYFNTHSFQKIVSSIKIIRFV